LELEDKEEKVARVEERHGKGGREGGREGGQNPKPFAQWASKLAELGGPDYSNIYDTSQAELIYAPLPFTYILIQH
jgi:hypothetical protein